MKIFARTCHFGHHDASFEAETLAEAIEIACAEFDNRHGLPKCGKSRIVEFWTCGVNLARYSRGKTTVRRGVKAKYPAFLR